MTNYLTRDAILNASDIETEEIEVPEWGGVVRVRGLSGTERDQFEQSMVEKRGKKREVNLANVRARLIALSVVDAQGNRLFGDADVAALGRKSAAALERVFDVARRLSGLNDEDVDELAQELTEHPFGDSSSTSPESSD